MEKEGTQVKVNGMIWWRGGSKGVAPDSVQSPGHAIPVLNILLFQIKERVASDIVIFDSSPYVTLMSFAKLWIKRYKGGAWLQRTVTSYAISILVMSSHLKPEFDYVKSKVG